MSSVTVQVAKRGLITLPKSLRDKYGVKPGDSFALMDLGGVFVLSRRAPEVDVLADRLAAEWRERGETLEGMLEAIREERSRYGE